MEKMKFEKAIEKLEKIVEELESGDLSLDDALSKYEEGIALSKFCSKRLNEADKKIEILMKKSDGQFETEPFLAEDEHVQKKEKQKVKDSNSKGKARGKRKISLEDKDNEDLLFS